MENGCWQSVDTIILSLIEKDDFSSLSFSFVKFIAWNSGSAEICDLTTDAKLTCNCFSPLFVFLFYLLCFLHQLIDHIFIFFFLVVLYLIYRLLLDYYNHVFLLYWFFDCFLILLIVDRLLTLQALSINRLRLITMASALNFATVFN